MSVTGFPTQYNTVQALGVEGAFATTDNAKAVVNAGKGQFCAGPNGVNVAKFVWLNSDGISLSNSGAGAPLGFLPRTQQALITTFLANASMTVPSGMPAAPFSQGDFWVRSSNGATLGQKAYASYVDGSITFAATGNAPTAASVTGSIAPISVTGAIAANTATGSIAGTTLTVTAIGAGLRAGCWSNHHRYWR